MSVKNRNGKKNIFRASTKHGTGDALASRSIRSRREPEWLEALRQMIANGELGAYKLKSPPVKAANYSSNGRCFGTSKPGSDSSKMERLVPKRSRIGTRD